MNTGIKVVAPVAFALLSAAPLCAYAQQDTLPWLPTPNPARNDSLPPRDAETVPWTDSEINAAKADCAKILADLALDYETLPPLKEGMCGAPAPILLKSIGSAPKVKIEPPATVTCKLAAALAGWLDKTVQPEARAAVGSAVIKLSNASSYVCRNRYNGADTPLSEHALANALDISEFVFRSGDKVTVLASWPRLVAEVPPPLPNPIRISAPPEITGSITPSMRTNAKTVQAVDVANATTTIAKTNPFVASPAEAKTNPFVLPTAAAKAPIPKPPAEATPADAVSVSARKGEFVTKVHQEACNTFGTVLGPNANDAHKDHFHFDMKQRRRRAFCE